MNIIGWINQCNHDQHPQHMIQDKFPSVTKSNLDPRNKATSPHISPCPGHQDTCNPKKPFHISETLNIDCNKGAAIHVIQNTKAAPPPSPLLLHGFPYLQIQQKVIHWNLQYALWDVTMFPMYYKYLLCNKFQWGKTIWHQLDSTSTSHVAPHKIQTIASYRNLANSYHLTSWYQVQRITSTNQCPSSKQYVKTAEHFLQSQQSDHLQVWSKIHESLHKLYENFKILQSIQIQLMMGLHHSHNLLATKVKSTQQTQPAPIAQHKLSWKQCTMPLTMTLVITL